MSEVYAKDRQTAKREFETTARIIQVEIAKYVMRERVMPKKYRIAFGYDLIKKANELVFNVHYANAIYPTNETELTIRRKYQNLAIANLFQIHSILLVILNCVQTTNVETIKRIIKKMALERKLLIGWRNANRICSKKEKFL
jgi:hypothetical protein